MSPMAPIDWDNSYIEAELRKHIALVAPLGVGLLTSPVTRERCASTIARFTSSEIRHFENPADVTPEGLGVIVVAAEGRWATHALRGQLTHLFDAGVPLVACTPERRFASSPPVPEHFGIDYPGMFWLASEYIKTVKRGASYVEFGVFDGLTFTLACHALAGVCDTFYAFDSFRGISGTLGSERTHFKDGQYAASVETFRYNLRLSGVDEARVRVVPGLFQETLVGQAPADVGLTSASIVHVDTDVYEPARLALEFVTPVLPQGALLLFDDYDQLAASNDRGERKAVRDWLAAHPEIEIEPYRAYGTFCRSFLVHRTR